MRNSITLHLHQRHLKYINKIWINSLWQYWVSGMGVPAGFVADAFLLESVDDLYECICIICICVVRCFILRIKHSVTVGGSVPGIPLCGVLLWVIFPCPTVLSPVSVSKLNVCSFKLSLFLLLLVKQKKAALLFLLVKQKAALWWCFLCWPIDRWSSSRSAVYVQLENQAPQARRTYNMGWPGG